LFVAGCAGVINIEFRTSYRHHTQAFVGKFLPYISLRGVAEMRQQMLTYPAF
jgi:hypothetical protein